MHAAGIILCGGKSTRMGYPKAMLPFGPELLLGRVVRLLGEVVSPIVVVAAPGQEIPRLPPEVSVVRDERESRGPLEGLRAGLAALAGRAEFTYATSCDVPLLVPAFVRRLIELAEGGRWQIVVPEAEGFKHPLSAVYSTSVLPEIESLLAADRLRPVFLFERVRTRVVDSELLRQVDPDLATLRNLNHPEDYLRALRDGGWSAPPELLMRLSQRL
jgi:molybdopterin-guanine dinucleotide biosynthesis protein A